ncbi:MAG TPA: DUF370 domain-containing protein [Methylomusa anaerophila]|uniref:DUF370 domain-containing protein n=1 Tax=Methylomusa anaerophila TaxID=1930071 RepID=A0A348AHL6_9FIRM|nr:extracellular matrix/biofilm biosynthesis regulator RemA family protein [Methylomusa anaerophila]BBB90564.1 hypothetical protein MAMMFC1_01218 [Methylomusa anaerophila]HML88830.1 DUF370 domain-containing protein [Methylomusa anaerophila]
MFLHLGADTVIRLSTVIAILDLKISGSGASSQYLKNMSNSNKVIDISENNAKSFILTDKTVYLSAISSQTLKKRAGHIPIDEN